MCNHYDTICIVCFGVARLNAKNFLALNLDAFMNLERLLQYDANKTAWGHRSKKLQPAQKKQKPSEPPKGDGSQGTGHPRRRKLQLKQKSGGNLRPLKSTGSLPRKRLRDKNGLVTEPTGAAERQTRFAHFCPSLFGHLVSFKFYIVSSKSFHSLRMSTGQRNSDP